MSTLGRCTICSHPQRREIENAHLGGESIRSIAARIGRSKGTVHRHLRDHVTTAAIEARKAITHREAGDGILGELQRLRDEANRLQHEAERGGDVRAALQAIRELTRLCELTARVCGELRDKEVSVTNVTIEPEAAARLAEIYLARRASAVRPEAAADFQSASRLQVLEAE